MARNKKRGYNSKYYHSAFDENQAFSQEGRSWGQNVKDAAAAALTTGALAIGAHGAVVEPLNPANGADQLGHYTSAQQEKNASESVQDGTNEAGNRSTETSQQG